jgi:hypothetical protein
LVENTFFRFKNAFGSKFLSRDEDNMENEMTIKCQLLNKMFEIGKPISVRLDKTRLWEKKVIHQKFDSCNKAKKY